MTVSSRIDVKMPFMIAKSIILNTGQSMPVT